MKNDVIDGFVCMHSNWVHRLPYTNTVMKNNIGTNKRVSILIGGDITYATLFLGLLGKGMADCYVEESSMGLISYNSICEAISASKSTDGVLWIHGTHTSDAANMEVAQKYAHLDGIHVEAIQHPRQTIPTGKKYHAIAQELATTLFIIKEAGAASEQGLPIEDIARIAKKVQKRSRSVSISVLGEISPSLNCSQIDPDEKNRGLLLELNHGQDAKVRRIFSGEDLSQALLDSLCGDTLFLTPGDHVVIDICRFDTTLSPVIFSFIRPLHEMLK